MSTVVTKEPSAFTVDVADDVPLVPLALIGVTPVMDCGAPVIVVLTTPGVTVTSDRSTIGGTATLATAVRPSSLATYIVPRLKATSYAEPGIGCEPATNGVAVVS